MLILAPTACTDRSGGSLTSDDIGTKEKSSADIPLIRIHDDRGALSDRHLHFMHSDRAVYGSIVEFNQIERVFIDGDSVHPERAGVQYPEAGSFSSSDFDLVRCRRVAR